MAPTSEEREMMADLHSKIAKLGFYELMVVREFVRRVYMGQRQYGPLEPKKKRWGKEKREEILDFFVYDCMESIADGEL